jgi:hypothetical protein
VYLITALPVAVGVFALKLFPEIDTGPEITDQSPPDGNPVNVLDARPQRTAFEDVIIGF